MLCLRSCHFLSFLLFQPGDLNALNVIHITGTKGKGSTSAFTDSILRHARPGMKVGMFPSFLCHLSSQSSRSLYFSTPCRGP